MNNTLYLMQKDSETRIEVDDDGYDRIMENGNVVGHHMSNPIVKLT